VTGVRAAQGNVGRAPLIRATAADEIVMCKALVLGYIDRSSTIPGRSLIKVVEPKTIWRSTTRRLIMADGGPQGDRAKVKKAAGDLSCGQANSAEKADALPEKFFVRQSGRTTYPIFPSTRQGARAIGQPPKYQRGPLNELMTLIRSRVRTQGGGWRR